MFIKPMWKLDAGDEGINTAWMNLSRGWKIHKLGNTDPLITMGCTVEAPGGD
jgi:hypothetical protein